MRQIIFRGKRIDNGEWVYGYYHSCIVFAKLSGHISSGENEVDINKHWILVPRSPQDIGWSIRDTFASYSVIPETIGQSIGLKDKDGFDIFEGDIIEHYRNDSDEDGIANKEWKVKCVVEWRDGKSRHLPHKDDNPSTANCNPQFIGKLMKNQKDGSYCWSEFHNCKIVSNIHDHEPTK